MSKCKILDEHTSKLNAIYRHVGVLREYVEGGISLVDSHEMIEFINDILNALNALQEEVNAVDKDE